MNPLTKRRWLHRVRILRNTFIYPILWLFGARPDQTEERQAHGHSFYH